MPQMIRFFDVFCSLAGLILFLPILIFVFILGFLDTGSPLFYQKRMGKNMKPFLLIKFRSMKVNSGDRPTHLMSKNSVTSLGFFLRGSKLDEIPQLINVLIGHMSIVGPRPNLMNQTELIEHRSKLGVYSVKPGITGLAQINKIDMSTPELLSLTDAKMIQNLNLKFYFKYIFKTALGKGFGDRIKL
jgi:O-antigen biosynthesis protein WbqP